MVDVDEGAAGSTEMFPEIVRKFDAIQRLAVGMPERFVFVSVNERKRTVGMNQPVAPVVSATFPTNAPPFEPGAQVGTSELPPEQVEGTGDGTPQKLNAD